MVMSFLIGLVLLMITAMVGGGLFAVLIFGKEPDGTMYFWTDDRDGKVYIEMQLNESDIRAVAKKKSITLDCVVVHPIKGEPQALSHETQSI